MIWKIFSALFFVLFVLSNFYWFYQVLDRDIHMSYYADSCEKQNRDKAVLLDILKGFNSKEKTIDFLRDHRVVFDSFYKKDEGFIIQLNSFDLTFDEVGEVKEINNY